MLYLSRNNLLVDLNGLVGKERRVSCSHFIDENTQGPPIHCSVVTLDTANTEMMAASYA